MSAVSAGVRVILPFPTDPPGSSRRKAAAKKRLDFAQTDYRFTQTFPQIFDRLYHRFKEQQLG